MTIELGVEGVEVIRLVQLAAETLEEEERELRLQLQPQKWEGKRLGWLSPWCGETMQA